MNSKATTLYALMEEEGYSYGVMNATIQLLDLTDTAWNELIVYLYENHPTEEEWIEKTATFIHHTQQCKTIK